jgi:hypothetical protein
MSFVSNLVPAFANDLYQTGWNHFYSIDKCTKENAKDLFLVVGRVVVAATICIAAYKGSLIAAGVLATASLPAASLAGGAILIKYGLTALITGLLNNMITQTVFGGVAFASGWVVLNNYKTTDFTGILEYLAMQTQTVGDIFKDLTNHLPGQPPGSKIS